MLSSLKISEKLHSAIILGTALAGAYQSGKLLTLAQIAKQFRLSKGYLEEVVTPLRNIGLVEGRRGIDGGYKLTRSPETITYADIIEAIEGPTSLMDCASCFLHDECSTEPIMKELEQQLITFLRTKTLADSMQHPKYQSQQLIATH